MIKPKLTGVDLHLNLTHQQMADIEFIQKEFELDNDEEVFKMSLRIARQISAIRQDDCDLCVYPKRGSPYTLEWKRKSVED